MLVLAAAALAAACPYPVDRVTAIPTRRALPVSALAAFGELAEKGAPFQVTDVIMAGPPLPFSRFVAAEAQGCQLTLHYEHGGIAHSWPTVRFGYVRGRGWALLNRNVPR